MCSRPRQPYRASLAGEAPAGRSPAPPRLTPLAASGGGQSDRVANLRSCMGEAAPALTGIELVLNRYRPLRPLGSGGSGSVWLARDERTGLDVALKIVAREGKSAMRAEREAKAAAHLRHPACLRAYGFG